jgi:hypothetical protein
LPEVQPSLASRPSKTTNALRVRHSDRTHTSPYTKSFIGKPVSHQFAKELLAGFAGAEVDKLAETKGEDWFDREKTKREAEKQAENMYDEHYVEGQGADQYDPNQYGRPQRFEQRGW